MYKVTIEGRVGEISKRTILETDDVELVKIILGVNGDVSVHSDVDNLNIDPEWQELLQWYRKKKEEDKTELKNLERFDKAVERLLKDMKENENSSIKPFSKPYLNPLTMPYDPMNPFTVTC